MIKQGVWISVYMVTPRSQGFQVRHEGFCFPFECVECQYCLYPSKNSYRTKSVTPRTWHHDQSFTPQSQAWQTSKSQYDKPMCVIKFHLHDLTRYYERSLGIHESVTAVQCCVARAVKPPISVKIQRISSKELLGLDHLSAVHFAYNLQHIFYRT